MTDQHLTRVFREGLLRAAAGTTGAWVLTCGLDNTSVVQQVARALDEAGISSRYDTVSGYSNRQLYDTVTTPEVIVIVVFGDQ